MKSVRLNSAQRRSRGCQARFRPSRASSVRRRLRSRGAPVRPAWVRGGFPPPEVPGSFFPVTPPVPLRGCSIGSWSIFDGCVVSSKSVARSAGLRSSAPGLQLGPVRFRPAPRPDPADRSPGPFRSRPLFRLYQLSSFRSIRLLLVQVRLSVRSARLLFGSSFVRFVFRSVRSLVRFRFS